MTLPPIRPARPALEVHPLDASRMGDLDALFHARGCAVARDCYCLYYRLPHASYEALRPAAGKPPPRRELMARLAAASPAPGLIGYREGVPAGWVSLGPRADFARLAGSPTMRAVDDLPVWSIVCFVVPSACRHQGVAHALLRAAIDFARAQGAPQLEAYPVDRVASPGTDAAWFGSLSMYEAAGFHEVARHRAGRPIVRLALAAA
jgi:GNAT superfamily N-acetyltransferase